MQQQAYKNSYWESSAHIVLCRASNAHEKLAASMRQQRQHQYVLTSQQGPAADILPCSSCDRLLCKSGGCG